MFDMCNSLDNSALTYCSFTVSDVDTDFQKVIVYGITGALSATQSMSGSWLSRYQ
jgi:hypothetical protein